MARMLTAAILGLSLVWAQAGPLQAAEHGRKGQTETPEQLAREGIDRLFKALELFIEMIPQYEAPELNEDGDIIIRRKHPGAEPPGDLEAEDTRA